MCKANSFGYFWHVYLDRSSGVNWYSSGCLETLGATNAFHVCPCCAARAHVAEHVTAICFLACPRRPPLDTLAVHLYIAAQVSTGDPRRFLRLHQNFGCHNAFPVCACSSACTRAAELHVAMCFPCMSKMNLLSYFCCVFLFASRESTVSPRVSLTLWELLLNRF